jgi:diguanylate cyclase (GGDEF)-like protein/PAS domain S-box-containing protein
VRRATLLALVAFLCAEALWAWSLRGVYQAEVRLALDHQQADLDVSLRSLIDGYGHTVDVATRTTIDRPEVRALLAEAAGADPEQARHLRGHLYRLLYPTYSVLRDNDLRDFQFVLPNGNSFLRFHRPDLFDDHIAADRPMLQVVLDRGEPGDSFEMGRVHPGYHFAYPLYEDAGPGHRLIGVADYGVSFAAIRRLLQTSGEPHGVASRFILRGSLLDEVGHPSARALYRPTPLHPDFVAENEESSLGDTGPVLSLPPWVDALERQLSQDVRGQQAIAAGRPHTALACTNLEDCYTVALRPILDSTQRVAGFLNAYSPAPGIVDTRNRLLFAFVAGTLMILGAGVTLRRTLAANERLRSISEHMAEGLCVIDSAGNTIYTNVAASQLLGYASHELVGQPAHKVIQPSDGAAGAPTEGFPLRQHAERGEVYRSDQEVFRRKDGGLLRVSVVSWPMREQGEVVGTVALFRDISAEYEARMRLRQAEIAFSHLAEAVVVTDAEGSIQVVNPAFTEITGYAEEEVRGKNPRILASGRHDRAFYERMWHAIRNLGYWEGEIWNKRKNGEVYPEVLKITAVRDAEKRIVAFVSVFTDIAEFRAKEERLRHLAYRDQLTGLYNRSAFMQIVEHAIHRARDRGGRLALLYLDIDRFKRINDTLGHVIGDALLRKIAQRIRKTLRAQDEAARLGGDEFVVLLEDIDQQATPARVAHALLERIRAPLAVDGKPLHITSSIGICVYPEDGDSPATLFKNADAAMYLAKQSGRDACRYFTAAMARDAEARFELETELRLALQTGQMRLAYQPKVALADGRVLGLEALVRWQHPREGLLLPGRFLSVAAENGLLQPLTQWVVGEVSRQCARWRADALAFGRLSCNIDASIFQPGMLEAMLLKTVATAGITPADLELEVLETGMLRETVALGLWGRLVAHGFELSIDDFGTGESSLARIKELPVSTLKIDRGFVRDLETDQGDRSIVRTVIAMARILGKRAVAEGVETDAQMRFLIDAGCYAVQGNWFSPAVPPEDIPDLIRNDRCRERLRELARERAPA